jgi:hypothetical protein
VVRRSSGRIFFHLKAADHAPCARTMVDKKILLLRPSDTTPIELKDQPSGTLAIV